MITAVRSVYYGDQDELLRDCLVPLARELSQRPALRGAWLQTRWEQGPLVVLFVDGEPEGAHAAARTVTERVEAFLARRSCTDVRPAAGAATEPGCGAPGVAAALPALPAGCPDRGAVVDTFLRGERAQAAMGRIMTAGMTAVDETIDETLAATPLLDAVLSAMAAVATAHPRLGLAGGRDVLRSHWAAYVRGADDGTLDARLERTYAAQRGALVGRLEAAYAGGVAARAADPALDVWAGWVETALPVALDLAAAGEVPPCFGAGTDAAAYGFTVHCFFELLPLLGVAPVQRYALAALVARAAEDVLAGTYLPDAPVTGPQPGGARAAGAHVAGAQVAGWPVAGPDAAGTPVPPWWGGLDG